MCFEAGASYVSALQTIEIPLDGAVVGQTKVSGGRQMETTHEICCLAAELSPKIL